MRTAAFAAAFTQIHNRFGSATAPAPAPVVFPQIGANLDVADEAFPMPLTTFNNLIMMSRGFAPIGDADSSYRLTTLDSDGWPTTDFLCLLPSIPDGLSVQTLLGISDDYLGTMTITNASGWSVAMQSTFDSGSGKWLWALQAPIGNRSRPCIHCVGTTRSGMGTNTGARNIKLFMPGLPVTTTALCTPSFIASCAGRKVHRYMDWYQINGNADTEWSTRSVNQTGNIPDSATGTVGLPTRPYRWETICQAVNETGIDSWLVLPTEVTDDYVAQWTALVDSLIDPARKIGVEVSNEVRNNGFSQTFYVLAKVCTEVNGFAGGTTLRNIVSVVVVAGVATVNVSEAHGYTNGETIWFSGLAGADFTGSAGKSITVLADKSFSYTGSMAPDGTYSGNGGMTIVGSITTDLNGYDGSIDVYQMSSRWVMRRIQQISAIIRSVVGDAKMMTRWRPLYMVFNATVPVSDPLQYLVVRYGGGGATPPGHWLYGAGHAFYASLDATPFGGSNLQVASTFNGHTPPAVADYITTLQLTVPNSHLISNADQAAAGAGAYGLKYCLYEGGPDTSGTGDGAINTNKNLAQFDASMKDSYVEQLNSYQRLDADWMCWFNSGIVSLGDTSQFVWGIYTTPADSTTAKTAAINQVLAAPKLALGRNVIALGVPIDARSIYQNYPPYSGGFPDINSTEGVYWLRQCPADLAGARTISVKVSNSYTDSALPFDVYVNEVLAGTISVPANTTTPADFPLACTLHAGNNSVRLGKKQFTGTFLSVRSDTYT